MKQMLKAAALMLIGVALIGAASCSNAQKEAEKARQESIARADSLAAVADALEQARLDSLRQDSIQKVTDFMNKVPTFSELYNLDIEQAASYLKALGFTKTTRGKRPSETNANGEFDDEATWVTTWKLKVDENHYCVVEISEMFEGGSTELIIVGAPQKLEESKRAARKVKNELDVDDVCYIEIGGNSINWGGGA